MADAEEYRKRIAELATQGLSAPVPAQPDMPADDTLSRLESNPNTVEANDVLARQKASAVRSGTDSVMDEDRKRRADLRTRLIMAGTKADRVDSEINRLMGPAPTPQTRENVQSAIAAGQPAYSRPEGIVGSVSQPNTNYSRGDAPPPEAPKPSEAAAPPAQQSPQPGAGGQTVVNFKPMVVPAHNQMLVAPGIQKGAVAAIDANNEAAGGVAVAESDLAHRKGMLDQIEANYLTANQRSVDELQKEKQAKVGMAMAEKGKWIELADQAPSEDRFWKDQGLANRFMMTIGAALLNFGNAIRGGDGTAGSKLLQDKIRAGVADQVKAAESAKWHADKMDGVLADIYKQTGDKEAAQELAFVNGLNMLDKRLDAVAQGTNSEVILNRVAAFKADNELKKAEILSKWNKWVPQQTVGGGPGKGVTRENVVAIGNGVGVQFPNKDLANKATEHVNALAQLKAGFHELQKLESEKPSVANVPARLAWEKRRDRVISDLETTYTVHKGQGAMSKDDRAVTDQAIGALRGWDRITGDQDQILKDAIAGVDRSRSALLNSASGMVVHQQIGHDANGNVVENWIPSGEVYSDAAAPISGRAAPMPSSFKADKK